MIDGGRTLNKRDELIRKAWLRLYICITTNDVKEFYAALSGKSVAEDKKHYTWEVANKEKPQRKNSK